MYFIVLYTYYLCPNLWHFRLNLQHFFQTNSLIFLTDGVLFFFFCLLLFYFITKLDTFLFIKTALYYMRKINIFFTTMQKYIVWIYKTQNVSNYKRMFSSSFSNVYKSIWIFSTIRMFVNVYNNYSFLAFLFVFYSSLNRH